MPMLALMSENKSGAQAPCLLEALACLAVGILLCCLLTLVHAHHPGQGGILQGLRVAPRGEGNKPKEPTHPQPDIIPVHRATGQPVNLRANFVAYLGWRWHVRALPPLNGVARLSRKIALEDWLAKHRQNISPESVRVVQARLDNWDQAPGTAAVPPTQMRGKGKGNPGKGPGRGVTAQGGPPPALRQDQDGVVTPPPSSGE